MDTTLYQMVLALAQADQELRQLRAQVQQLQAEYTDIKNQLEAKDALPATVR